MISRFPLPVYRSASHPGWPPWPCSPAERPRPRACRGSMFLKPDLRMLRPLDRAPQARWVLSPTAHIVDNLGEARRKLGILAEHYGSCHSAKVGACAVEGHVPAKDINAYSRNNPRPSASPCPECLPDRRVWTSPAQRFSTVLVLPNGTSRPLRDASVRPE